MSEIGIPNTGFADPEGQGEDAPRVWHRSLPFLAQKVVDKGYDLPLPYGVGLTYTNIEQEPIIANDYKRRGNDLDGWRKHMRRLRDPIFDRPGKQLIYDKRVRDDKWWLHRGWQDWEMLSVEVAIPEPFILHSGINVKLGFDPSQIFDLALGLFGLDLYSDNAYRFNGDLRFTEVDDIDVPEKVRY